MDRADGVILQASFDQFGKKIAEKFKEVYDKNGYASTQRNKEEFIALIEKELAKLKLKEDSLKEIVALATLLFLMFTNQIIKD